MHLDGSSIVGDLATQEHALLDSLTAFSVEVGEALGVCSYGLTIGETYVPFRPDPEDECEEDEEYCTQAWLRVISVRPNPNSNSKGWGGACAATRILELEVGITRCLGIPEDGEAPMAGDVLSAAWTAMEDMSTIATVATSSDLWIDVELGMWSPNGPSGGVYGGQWTIQVEL